MPFFGIKIQSHASFRPLIKGIQWGLFGAIPLFIQAHTKAQSSGSGNYGMQADFAWSSWPPAFRLLWMPLIDTLFFRRVGRRKSWLLPAHLLMGVIFLGMAPHINAWLGRGDDKSHEIAMAPLTIAFFVLHLLCSTAESVIDGWGISMLAK